MRSTASPAHAQSSRDRAPRDPAQRMATSRPPPAAQAAAAVTLTSAATPIAAAARAARSARVPLLVVKKTVLPRTWAVRNSRGELLRSNPGIGSPRRSPATSTPSPPRSPARRRASGGSAAGTIARQPFASAVVIVVVGGRAAVTRAGTPARSSGGTAVAGAMLHYPTGTD